MYSVATYRVPMYYIAAELNRLLAGRERDPV